MNGGDRVELLGVTADDLRFGLAAGDCGTVDVTDSLGTVHVRWDSGAGREHRSRALPVAELPRLPIPTIATPRFSRPVTQQP